MHVGVSGRLACGGSEGARVRVICRGVQVEGLQRCEGEESKEGLKGRAGGESGEVCGAKGL